MSRRPGLAVLLVIVGGIAIQLILADRPTAPTIWVAVADQGFAIPNEYYPFIAGADVRRIPGKALICQAAHDPPFEASHFTITPSQPKTKTTELAEILSGAQFSVHEQRPGMVSAPLAEALTRAEVERRGMPPEALAGSNAGVGSFPGIDDWRNAGSDHAGAFAGFDFA